MTKGMLIVILSLPYLAVHPQARQADVWQPLRFLEGTWEGQGDGMSGISSVTQGYHFILNGQFLRMTTRSVFKPQQKNPDGEVHEDMGFFSFDRSRKKFVLRAFYIEGYINQYTGTFSEDGNTLTFESESVENAPKGTKAKLIFRKTGENGLEQSFHVAFPGADFNCYSTNRLKRNP